MTHGPTDAVPSRPGRDRPWRRRPFLAGFVVGVALVVPAVLVALLVPGGDTVLPFLVPGAALLRPLSPVMATWPGAVNLLLAAVVNGLIFGALVVALARARGSARR